MAATSITPNADLVSLEECVTLFREADQFASKSTLTRWIRKHHLPTEYEGRTEMVSWSDVLEVHRDEMAKRD